MKVVVAEQRVRLAALPKCLEFGAERGIRALPRTEPSIEGHTGTGSADGAMCASSGAVA